MTNWVDPNISIITRDVSRVSPDLFASVSYHPVRGKGGHKSRIGKITSVGVVSDEKLEFVIHDEERERDVEISVSSILGESSVRSRKDERWTTLGKPLRVEVGDASDDYNDFMFKGVQDAYEGRYTSIVAVAAVRWNERILDWFDWSNRHS
jgi:hypothetical protein